MPAEIGREAMLHDLHCVVALAQRILTSPDPAAWIRECRNAGDVAHGIAADHRVLLTVPPSGSCQVE